jgi:hypothetical protein
VISRREKINRLDILGKQGTEEENLVQYCNPANLVSKQGSSKQETHTNCKRQSANRRVVNRQHIHQLYTYKLQTAISEQEIEVGGEQGSVLYFSWQENLVQYCIPVNLVSKQGSSEQTTHTPTLHIQTAIGEQGNRLYTYKRQSANRGVVNRKHIDQLYTYKQQMAIGEQEIEVGCKQGSVLYFLR